MTIMCVSFAVMYFLIGFMITLLNNHLLSNKLVESVILNKDIAMKIVLALMVVFWPVCLSLTLRLIIVNFTPNSK